MLEAGAHDPKPMIRHGHSCAGGTAQMLTLQPSIKTSWVYALRVVLSMGLVGHPWCTQACVEVAYMLGSQPSPRGFLGHIIGHAEAFPVYLKEEGWCQLLHLDNFLQVMLDQFTQLLLLCPLSGLFHGIPSSYWSNDDITPLPAEAPPPPGESSNQGCSCPDTILRMCYASRLDYSILHSSFSF